MITKKRIINIILLIWVIFSVAYVCYNILRDFANKKYMQGKADTINALIEQTKGCDPVLVSSETIQIQVVNATCLNNSAILNTGTKGPTSPPPSSK